MLYEIQHLSGGHDKNNFDCGVAGKNEFLRRFASQNAKKGIGRTFVAVLPPDISHIYGYYTLASGSVRFDNLPVANLPRYPVPTVNLAKLAIDKSAQGRGLGSALLFDALERTAKIAEDLGVFAVEVKALDDAAKKFYLKYGFAAMLDDPMHLYLPIKNAKALFGL